MSRLRKTLTALLLIAPVCLFAQDVRDQKVWTSHDGRSITAALLELNAGSNTAKMKREDGLIFEISLHRFAQSDADRLRQAAKELEVQKTPEPEDTKDISAPAELPDKFILKDVPMVRQKGNFCVPASATMIAGFHGIKTDQDQIAFLSSAKSIGNQGTNPHDMLLAMEKLGFDGQALYWKNPADFHRQALPAIQEALVHKGPIYISFAPGVFGENGHGCVITGYHDRKEKLTFHNPWGDVFEKDYEEVAQQGRGIVLIEAPQSAPIASECFIQEIETIIPKFDGDILKVAHLLGRSGAPHELLWCSRRDAREDKKFAVDTARDDGRKILDLSFHRNPAVLIPASDRDGKTEKYLFVTRPPEGGAQFMVREITTDGWSKAELVTLGSLTRAWPTRIESTGQDIWELPMIELHSLD